MADRFANTSDVPSGCARRHFAITPSDSADLAVMPKALYCQSTGNVAIRDELGVDLTYAVAAGNILPVRPTRVLATGTTATVYGLA